MSLTPKKNFIWFFDAIAPSRYLLKFRQMMVLDAVPGYDIATRGRIPHYGSQKRKEFTKSLKKIRYETDLLLEDIEAYNIFMAVQSTRKVAGDIAEVGVYRGGSAKIICAAKGDRELHLFDTFEGLPRVDKIDEVWPFYEGKFAAPFDEVKKYLADEQKVFFYKGIFPDTSGPVKDRRFSLVNLDVDTYESTRQCLIFFYPRMNPGGIIISHDYLNAPGVTKAFDEFFADKPEPVVETAGSQCFVVKI